jgi:hypothetical protein
MSDSFADLWSTSAPSKPAASPRPLGKSPAPSASSVNPNRKPTYDAFSMLASSGTFSPPAVGSARASPAPNTSASQARQPDGGIPLPGMARANLNVSSGGGSGDAFSGLLAGSLSGGSGGSAALGNMTMAQRAAKAQQDAVRGSSGGGTTGGGMTGNAGAWAGLDSLGGFGASPARNTSSKANDDLFDLDALSVPTSSISRSPAPAPVAHDDDWPLDDTFAASPIPPSAPVTSRTPMPAPKPTTKAQGSLWDMDEFSALDAAPAAPPRLAVSPAPPVHTSPRPNSPGDAFDFGDREDGLLNAVGGDEDDILGMLSKPVSTTPARASSVRPQSAL